MQIENWFSNQWWWCETSEIKRQIRSWVSENTMFVSFYFHKTLDRKISAMVERECRVTRRRLHQAMPMINKTQCTNILLFVLSIEKKKSFLKTCENCRKTRSNEDDDNNTTNTDDSDGNKPKKDKWGFEIEGKGK